jgi:hypothetical protein
MDIKLVHEHTFDVGHVDKIVNRLGNVFNFLMSTEPPIPSPYLGHHPIQVTPPTPSPRHVFALSPSSKPGFYFPLYAPCAAVHYALSDCSSVPLDCLFKFTAFKWPSTARYISCPAVLNVGRLWRTQGRYRQKQAWEPCIV